MIRGLLKNIVLKALEEGPKSGYELMQHLDTLGSKPSPGSIYPLLKHLKDDGLVAMKKLGRKNEYHLTPRGRKAADEAKGLCKAFLDKHDELMSLYASMTGEKIRIPPSLRKDLESGKVPFLLLDPEMQDFKSEILRLVVREDFRKIAPKVKRVLKKTTRELKAL